MAYDLLSLFLVSMFLFLRTSNSIHFNYKYFYVLLYKVEALQTIYDSNLISSTCSSSSLLSAWTSGG